MTPIHRTAQRWTPLASVCVAVAWVSGIGFRSGWWHTGVLDHGWNTIQTDTASRAGHAAAQVMAVLGTGLPAVGSVLLVAALAQRAHGWLLGSAVVLIAGLDQLDVAALKLTAGRLRPDSAYGLHTSFPSGHTALAALLATLVALLLLPRWWRPIAAAWPVLVAWSRTELHAHWLTDVLQGAVLGWATAVLLLLATTTIARRRAARQPRTVARLPLQMP